MKTSTQTTIKNFSSDARGSVMITFGLIFFAITLASGVAIDYGRIHHAHSRLAAAADAAAIAAGKALLDGRNTDDDVKRIAEQFFKANIPDDDNGYAKVSNVTAVIDRNTNSVTINLASQVEMTVMKIAGYEHVDLPVTSVATFNQHDIELAVALDLTGSMCNGGGGAPCYTGPKIDALKNATKDMVDILLPDEGTPNKVRIGFAPYSAGVNAGPYASASTDGRSTDGCTYERQGFVKDGDQAPGTGDYLAVSTDVGSRRCPPNAEVIALTADKQILKDTVDGYQADGTTAGHTGAAWASYLVSPNWGHIFGTESVPVAYDDEETVKAVVLMTDGQNNTYAAAGGGGSQSDQLFGDICSEMRGKQILVFTIGFGSMSTHSKDLLKDCALVTDRYFHADDEQQLRDAFVAIAQQLTKLRLSK